MSILVIDGDTERTREWILVEYAKGWAHILIQKTYRYNPLSIRHCKNTNTNTTPCKRTKFNRLSDNTPATLKACRQHSNLEIFLNRIMWDSRILLRLWVRCLFLSSTLMHLSTFHIKHVVIYDERLILQ